MTAAVGSIAAIGLQADSVQQSDDRQADDGGSRKYSGDRITGRFGTAKRSGRQAGYSRVSSGKGEADDGRRGTLSFQRTRVRQTTGGGAHSVSSGQG
jgi:hypothetical protein